MTFAFDSAKKGLPGPDILGDAFVLAAQLSLEKSGQCLAYEDGKLAAAEAMDGWGRKSQGSPIVRFDRRNLTCGISLSVSRLVSIFSKNSCNQGQHCSGIGTKAKSIRNQKK